MLCSYSLVLTRHNYTENEGDGVGEAGSRRCLAASILPNLLLLNLLKFTAIWETLELYFKNTSIPQPSFVSLRMSLEIWSPALPLLAFLPSLVGPVCLGLE